MKVHSPQAVATKTSTGIRGFDEITEGGLAKGRTTLVMGGAGCGKTVFALQSLAAGANTAKEPGIFVAFEEPVRQILANAASFGWDLVNLSKKKIFFFDARLSPDIVKAGEFDLVGMLGMLKAKVQEIGAKRIVFDGIDVLLSLLDDPNAERREVYRIRDWMSEMGLTGIITQKVGAHEDERRHSFLQFMVDCVVILRHQVDDGTAFRSLRIMKYRGSSFSGGEFPITLDTRGMSLSHRGPVELAYKVSNERISSGLSRLDTMLSGGYFRGSIILVSGAPGTAKSTLSGLFAEAACERGERTLYVSFDEGADQISRNLRSVGIRLAPHRRSGLLKMFSTRTHGRNIDEQFIALQEMVLAFEPRCLVVDPFSTLSSKNVHHAAVDTAQQFLDFLKTRQITVVNTSLMDGLATTNEATATAISTVADTWIHLSYFAQDGERNRALTIVKSRGMGHSNQVRELTLSEKGVDLADVFISQGKVLMGVARWEWEQRELEQEKRGRLASDQRRLQLEIAQAEAVARIEVMKKEMDGRDAELARLLKTVGAAATLFDSDRAVLKKMRRADEDAGPHAKTRPTKKHPIKPAKVRR